MMDLVIDKVDGTQVSYMINTMVGDKVVDKCVNDILDAIPHLNFDLIPIDTNKIRRV